MILRYFLGALMDEMILYMSDTIKVRQRANKVVNKGCCEVELHDYFFKSKKHADRGAKFLGSRSLNRRPLLFTRNLNSEI